MPNDDTTHPFPTWLATLKEGQIYVCWPSSHRQIYPNVLPPSRLMKSIHWWRHDKEGSLSDVSNQLYALLRYRQRRAGHEGLVGEEALSQLMTFLYLEVPWKFEKIFIVKEIMKNIYCLGTVGWQLLRIFPRKCWRIPLPRPCRVYPRDSRH